MLDILKADLSPYNLFNGEVPIAIEKLSKAIPNAGIPSRMKALLAASELVLFASQFRRNIIHWNGSQIPINAISFSLAESGKGKDSSVNALRKCFRGGYDKINKLREAEAKQHAIKLAASDGVENPNSPKEWKKYYEDPTPLFVQPSTVEGFIQHLNSLDRAGIGSGYVYSGELGSELVSSKVIIENIQFLSETYDEGSKEVKVLKNKENQSKEIKNLPVSALFVGSQDNILFNNQIKEIFKREFSTKLARRSFFNFNPDKIIPPKYTSGAELIAARKGTEFNAIKVTNELEEGIEYLTDFHLPKVGEHLAIDEEVIDLFILYERYNYEISETISTRFSISKLVRLHLQWKALKLAGAIAMFTMHDSITIDDYVQAIRFVELLDEDMLMFEAELSKEPYELFVSYMHSIAEEGQATINLHELRKREYIPKTGNSDSKIKELITLAAAYDTDGVYSVVDGGIHFKQIIKTYENGVSFRSVSGSKEERARQCAYGFEFTELPFSDLAQMLTGDYAYTPFEFKDGVRSKENIISGCKWICLDIDKSTITDEESHFILQDFNHHIVRTSDADNPFKFRILVELDSYVDIEDRVWKHFIKSICDHLQLEADSLPKSQIFFSYANRNILSVTDKEPLAVKDHLMLAHSMLDSSPAPKALSKAEKASLLSNLRDTMWYAYEAEDGEGSVSMIRALKHLNDLGGTADDAYTLIADINDYWVAPIDPVRLEKTILCQIPRIFN